MYPSSSSSSHSHTSVSQAGAGVGVGLTRYGSAPGSLLTSTVEAVIGPYYSGDSSESNCKDQGHGSSSYDNHAFGSALLRQKSTPAAFLSHLAATTPNHSHSHSHNAGFTITRGSSHSARLKSQLSFTGHCQESENSNNVVVGVGDPAAFAWDSSTSIAFSAPPTKRSKNGNDPSDILHCLTALESQFSLPQTTLEMATVEKLLHIPEDSVPCKIRAKRGCATHPRSIAERERRTRISGKLKKLQDLVPNMDKQTSYADMLDLAVQHIKGLQSQVQKLHKELENCTCGCKQSK
ncbi:transcription factor bHLH128 [Abrus precatorius]|uniref:Transcription factor bHLH128 n=1 Tax=Abrus precatorius TaxID=3816 RepID=A0A8B8M5P2_ABRPR|nr:transcription factor bHLH128 [Abrus precatorius]